MLIVTQRRWLLIGLVILIAAGSGLWFGKATNPVGPWFDRAGDPVPDGQLSVSTGSDHCGWQNTRFMALAWPLVDPGRKWATPRHGFYIWKTGDDDYSHQGLAPPRFVADMPSDATNTGLRRGRLELWVSPSTLDQGVFVTDGDTIQRWAFTPEPACA